MAAHGEADTPYGPVVKELVLQTSDGQASVLYTCPLALMFYLCAQVAGFAGLLAASVQRRLCRIVCYVDEVRPGNVLRPDKGRATQCC